MNRYRKFIMTLFMITMTVIITYTSSYTLVEASTNSDGTFTVIVLLEYSPDLDTLLAEAPELVPQLRITVSDQVKIIYIDEAIANTLGNPAQIEFIFDNNRIPEGEFVDVCINYTDESYAECKTVANSPLYRTEIIPFDIG